MRTTTIQIARILRDALEPKDLARVAEALAETPQGAVVVTHAGPIRAARMILTGAGFAQVFAEPVPHCTPIRMRRLAQEPLESGRAEA